MILIRQESPLIVCLQTITSNLPSKSDFMKNNIYWLYKKLRELTRSYVLYNRTVGTEVIASNAFEKPHIVFLHSQFTNICLLIVRLVCFYFREMESGCNQFPFVVDGGAVFWVRAGVPVPLDNVRVRDWLYMTYQLVPKVKQEKMVLVFSGDIYCWYVWKQRKLH